MFASEHLFSFLTIFIFSALHSFPSFSLHSEFHHLSLYLSFSSLVAVLYVGITFSLSSHLRDTYMAFSIVIAHASDLSRGSLRSTTILEHAVMVRTLLHIVYRSTQWTQAIDGEGGSRV